MDDNRMHFLGYYSSISLSLGFSFMDLNITSSWLEAGWRFYTFLTWIYELQVTVYKQRASRLAALNERLIGIKIGDFWWVVFIDYLLSMHGRCTNVKICMSWQPCQWRTCSWAASWQPFHHYIEVNIYPFSQPFR